MRKHRMTDLGGGDPLAALVPAHRVDGGGVARIEPGERSHPEGRHVHDDPEAFLILAGHGTVEIDGAPTGISAGDVLVVEPGEDHHLVASLEEALTTVWLHLRPAG